MIQRLLLLFTSEYVFSHVDYFITTANVVRWPLVSVTVHILGSLVVTLYPSYWTHLQPTKLKSSKFKVMKDLQ